MNLGLLRKIDGKTKIDIIRKQQITETCGIQPIYKWVERKIKEWDEYDVKRMDGEKMAKI